MIRLPRLIHQLSTQRCSGSTSEIPLSPRLPRSTSASGWPVCCPSDRTITGQLALCDLCIAETFEAFRFESCALLASGTRGLAWWMMAEEDEPTGTRSLIQEGKMPFLGATRPFLGSPPCKSLDVTCMYINPCFRDHMYGITAAACNSVLPCGQIYNAWPCCLSVPHIPSLPSIFVYKQPGPSVILAGQILSSRGKGERES